MNTAWLSVPLLAFAAVAGPLPSHYAKIDFPKWTYNPPHPKEYRVVLKDGVVAYLVPDSTLDLIQFELLCGRPTLPRKPEEAAMLRLYSGLLKSGGTVGLTPERLEDSLEFMAAALSASVGDYQSQASFDGLGKNAGSLFGLLPDVALKPGLDPEVFKVEQRALVEALKHRYDTPRGVMGPAFERVMHGGHPSNWAPLEKEVLALAPQSLRPFAGAGFTRQGLVLGVAGRFEKADMIRRLNAWVDAFPPGAKAPEVPAFKGPRKPGVYLVDKPFSQATIRLGAMGVRRPHPDYYRLVVASYVFGEGGFTSRLMARVRSDEGLAYGIGSEIESDYNRTGTVYVGLQTKAPTGAYAVKLVLEEMRRMRDKGITDDELARAKDGLLKSLPSLFDSPVGMARIFAQGEVWKRSPDHFVEYQKALETMTRKEAEEAFRKYFDPDSLRIVMVGPKDVLLKRDEEHQVSLSDFGPVAEMTGEELDKRE